MLSPAEIIYWLRAERRNSAVSLDTELVISGTHFRSSDTKASLPCDEVDKRNRSRMTMTWRRSDVTSCGSCSGSIVSGSLSPERVERRHLGPSATVEPADVTYSDISVRSARRPLPAGRSRSSRKRALAAGAAKRLRPSGDDRCRLLLLPAPRFCPKVGPKRAAR